MRCAIDGLTRVTVGLKKGCPNEKGITWEIRQLTLT